ncbi:MAG: 30S ribosomal protein S4e [Candidatus Aenigmatarchaeota archaeon]
MWLKRLNAPRFWRQKPKENKYSVNPSCGPHPKDYCIPIAIILRDILNYAENLKEAKQIVKQRKVLVDQRVIKNYRFPCGLFDVISFPDINEFYRITVNKSGLCLIKIEKDEANLKIVKVIRKTKISDKKYQLTFHDGKNIVVEENEIKPHDSLLIDLASFKILKYLKFEENSLALVFRGENCGKVGKIISITKGSFNRKWLVELKTEGEKISTIRDYVIVVGDDKSLISI